MAGEIHHEHPFLDPEASRDPIRRFRGRLSSPVTVVTAGGERDRAGLTVSSLLVAGDAAPLLEFVVGPDSYLLDAIQAHRAFVVHVLDSGQRDLSDRFAGVRPSPGGPFAGLEVSGSEYGPVLAACRTRASCDLAGVRHGDGFAVVEGAIAEVSVHELGSPLQWFRGSYRRLDE